MPTLQFRGRAFIERYHESLPHYTLNPQAALSVLPEEGKPSLDGNLIIEGDNLLALQALLPYYRGRVKCIYIDPPYNTGNENWVYNDNVSGALFKEWLGKEVGPQGEDFNRHEKWCCMMWPRLQLLRELLREDGVIFISIDDNEVHHLRMLMDEVFGEENFIANIVWQKRTAPEARTVLGAAHDFVVVYAREKHRSNINKEELNIQRTKEYKNPDKDVRGDWASVDLTGQVGHATPNQFYTIISPAQKSFPPPAGRCWAVTEESFNRLLADGRIWFGAKGDARPRMKKFLSEGEGQSVWTWWSNSDVGHNQEATKELNDVLGELSFDSPKPSRLLRRIFRLVTESEGSDIILDSFAGSGTSAQAVLQLNKEDGGNRRFILVQMPYDNTDDERAGKNIARDITRERVRRVIEGVGDKVPALSGSFTYATLSDEPLQGYYGMIRPGTPWDELASYVWQAETMTAFDPAKSDPKTGRLGQMGALAVYLFYTPQPDNSLSLNAGMLKELAQETATTLILYCEKLWVDADALRLWARDQKKVVQARLLPTQLR
jgi:adenine-specific DNA-methyltransferase